MTSADPNEEQIRRVVARIDELWLSKDYDAIGELLVEDVVIVPPGFEGRVRGRAAYVQSYRDYDQVAQTVEFHREDAQVDLFVDLAVVVSPFRVVYDMEAKRHRERGYDQLVLTKRGGQWRVAWRTMQILSSAE